MHFDALRKVGARAARPQGSIQAWTEINELESPSKWTLLSNAVQEAELVEAVGALRTAGIEPILLKGWGVARLYPAHLTRPLGDVDLLVSTADAAAAAAVIQQHSGTLRTVDLHLDGAATLPSFATLLSGSTPQTLAGCTVRVPCYEHQLSIVSLHMLRHGAWRPLWLVDVAVLMEGRPANLDWDVCLGRRNPNAQWVLTALVLAHRLLGAGIAGTPAEQYSIPDWLVPEVLKRWEQPDPADHQPPESIFTSLGHPWRLPQVIRKRWPDPIGAVIATGHAFPERPTPLFYNLQYMAQLVSRRFLRSR